MSKHRYQLGMEGAGATTRGAARSAGSRGSPPRSAGRRETPGRARARSAGWRLGKGKRTYFSARDTAALLLDCDQMHRVELALLHLTAASRLGLARGDPSVGAWRIPLSVSAIYADVCYGHQGPASMSKHRYQLGIGGAEATTRGAARSAGSRGSPPMPQASEFASACERERSARPPQESLKDGNLN